MRSLVAGVIAAAALAPLSNAQPASQVLEACPTPEILSGPTQSFDDLYSRSQGLSVEKGEFETTAQYEARRAAAQGPGPALIEVGVENDWFEYDADKEQFTLNAEHFQPFALPFQNDYDLDEELYGRMSFGTAVFLPVYIHESSEEPYLAQNAFGAEFTVKRETQHFAMVFDRPPRDDYSARFDTLFTENDDLGATEYRVRLTFAAPLESAASLKQQLTAVAYVAPKAPFADDFRHFMKGTARAPRDLTTITHVVHADIQCFGIRDGAGNVLAHWKTR